MDVLWYHINEKRLRKAVSATRLYINYRKSCCPMVDYIEKYGLYEDIKENVSETILEFFKFDDIVNEILSSNAKN